MRQPWPGYSDKFVRIVDDQLLVQPRPQSQAEAANDVCQVKKQSDPQSDGSEGLGFNAAWMIACLPGTLSSDFRQPPHQWDRFRLHARERERARDFRRTHL